MARKLTVGVVLRHPDGGSPVFLPAGSELPGWAAGMVGEHALETAPAPAPRANPDPVPARAAAQPPPKAGPGSGRTRWAEYADAHSVQVLVDDTRDDIIAAVAAAGVPTE